MLEIKTIMHNVVYMNKFDEEVNQALAEGWELVRRDILPAGEGPSRYWERTLYAELEREAEPEEEEEPEDDSTAEWALIRNPVTPFKCSKCGHKNEDAPKTCPNCKRRMLGLEN